MFQVMIQEDLKNQDIQKNKDNVKNYDDQINEYVWKNEEDLKKE